MYLLSQYVIVCQGWVAGLYLIAGLAHQPASVEPVMAAPAGCFLLFEACWAVLMRVLMRVVCRTASCVVRSKPVLQLGVPQR